MHAVSLTMITTSKSTVSGRLNNQGGYATEMLGTGDYLTGYWGLSAGTRIGPNFYAVKRIHCGTPEDALAVLCAIGCAVCHWLCCVPSAVLCAIYM